MPRAPSFHPHCLKPIEKYLPRCLALILFTCSLTSLAFPPALGHKGKYPQSPTATDFANSSNVLMLAGSGDSCSNLLFGAASVGVGTNPTSVVLGEFNGDGKADLAVANGGSNNVSILLSNGDGSFQTAVNYAVGANPDSVAVGDFNGDGKADLAVANYGSDNVSILLGNGDGTFQAAVNYPAGSYPTSVAVADFNRDGILDLAVADSHSNNVSILQGNGNGTFQVAVSYGVGSAPSSVVAGDFNGDGKPDLAVANSGADSVSILLGNGNGTFQIAINYGTGSYPVSIAVGDFNGDGKQDLVVANSYSDNVSILLGNGNGTFAGAVYYITGSYPGSIAVGDFNGDAKPDLAVANRSNSISILMGNGDGTFPAAVSFGVGFTPYSVAAEDFNGDDKRDLAVAAYSSNKASILLGNGDGTFQTQVTYGVGSAPSSVAVGDFNGDGKPDIAAANSGSDTVSILLGNGDGTFQASVSYGVGSGPDSVAVGDFNGDGKADLAIANYGSDNVSILLGNGNGTFDPAVSYNVGYGPSLVAIGDFNGDGKPDLALQNSGPIYIGGGRPTCLSIMLGRGDGTFQAAVCYQIADYRTSAGPIVVADFNADGNPDVAVGLSWSLTEGNGHIEILLGNGDGTFRGGFSYDTGGDAVSIVVGDFNGDGKADLAVGAQPHFRGGQNSLLILLGQGDGTFQLAINYEVGFSPVVVGDFNGDGRLDLMGRNVSIMLGRGDGMFQTAGGSYVGSDPSVAIGDFNGDGKPDLAVVNGESNNVSILINTAACNIISLTSLSPPSAFAGGAAFNLTVDGSNFVSGSTVNWNGNSRSTTFISSTKLIASIPASDISTPGTAEVTVTNPVPHSGFSTGLIFTINIPNNPAPTITSLNPTSRTVGGEAFTLTVNGTNFISSSSVQWNGSSRGTTFVSTTQLTAAITAADIAAAGTISVTVVNPAPGGGNSNAQTFTVNNPVPSISSLSPAIASAGGAAFTLTVNGTNFVSSSTVQWNGSSRTTTFVSSTQLTAAIAATDIATGGTISVTVVNPSPGGGTSNAQTFTTNNPTPALSSLSPPSVAAGSPAFTLTVTGSNFVSTSKVRWNGSDRTTTYVRSTQLGAAMLAADVAAIGSAQVTVFNPTPGGGTSNSQTFTIAATNPVPTITSLNPSSAAAGGAAFTLTVNGTNFVTTSTVNWNGSSRTTTYVTTTQVTAAITAADIASAGTISVTVVSPSPGGGTSNAQAFSVNNPVPALSSLSPAIASAGGAAFTLTVNGTNFVGTSVVMWNGSSRTTTFVNSTQLTASIAAADIASVGTASVTIFNPAPGGGTSNAVTFTIAPAGTHLAEITSPVPGSTLTSTQVTFTWTSGTGVSQYWLYVGITSGGNEIYNQDEAGSQSATVRGIPNDGSTVYVRLWSKIASQWLYLDYTYKACSGCGPFLPGKAILVSPSSANVPTTPTYVWNAVPAATWYQLWVNDSSATPKIQTWYTAEQAGCAIGTGFCSVTPTISLALGAARWWIQTWNSVGYGPWSDGMSFTVASCTAPDKPILVSPSGYVSITQPTYSWNAVLGSAWYYLWVNDGATAGKVRQWYTAADLGCSTGSDRCAATPGTSLAAGWAQWWIQPWKDCGGGSYGPWSDGVFFYVGTSAFSPAVISSPTPNSILTSSSTTFTWNAGTGPTQYWLYVGRSLGSHELYSQDQGSGLSATVPGLPTDGSILYVRLWSYIGGQWFWRDYTYAACNGCQ